MDLNVNLPQELEAPLERAARSEGMTTTEFVVRTLEQALLNGRHGAALEMLRRWRAEDAGADAAQIADRKRSWEAFKSGMNENHSSGRKVFP